MLGVINASHAKHAIRIRNPLVHSFQISSRVVDRTKPRFPKRDKIAFNRLNGSPEKVEKLFAPFRYLAISRASRILSRSYVMHLSRLYASPMRDSKLPAASIFHPRAIAASSYPPDHAAINLRVFRQADVHPGPDISPRESVTQHPAGEQRARARARAWRVDHTQGLAINESDTARHQKDK